MQLFVLLYFICFFNCTGAKNCLERSIECLILENTRGRVTILNIKLHLFFSSFVRSPANYQQAFCERKEYIVSPRMLYWQVIFLFILFITTICIPTPNDIEEVKVCAHFTGSFNGNAKCALYCKRRGKAGGSCKRKRCVCNNGRHKGDDSNNSDMNHRPLSFHRERKLVLECHTDSVACQLDCRGMGNYDGSCINGFCICSRL